MNQEHRTSRHPTSPTSASRPSWPALVDGDTAAVFTLYEHHGHRVAGVVRRQLRRCGLDRIAPEDLRSLVLDACMELLTVAPSWRPGGALPWWWAEGRIRAVVNGWVGVYADSIDDHGQSAEETDPYHPPADEDTVAETFARLVDEVPLVGLVAEAAREARIDQTILLCLLDYAIQQDRRPSPRSLARLRGSPDALRQRVSRSRNGCGRSSPTIPASPRWSTSPWSHEP
ncbi:MAG: hypothetical protein U5K30_09830 [Acidimicrobiales bacterium]|nr:hypothetical protein [Acidimicrobiales bacterium]